MNTGSAHTSKLSPNKTAVPSPAGRGCDSWRRAGVPRGTPGQGSPSGTGAPRSRETPLSRGAPRGRGARGAREPPGQGSPGAGRGRCRRCRGRRCGRRLALTSGPGHSGAGDHIHACPRRLLLELQRGKGVEKGEGRVKGSEKEQGEGRVKRGGEDGGSAGTCPATPGRSKRPRGARCSWGRESLTAAAAIPTAILLLPGAVHPQPASSCRCFRSPRCVARGRGGRHRPGPAALAGPAAAQVPRLPRPGRGAAGGPVLNSPGSPPGPPAPAAAGFHGRETSASPSFVAGVGGLPDGCGKGGPRRSRSAGQARPAAPGNGVWPRDR